MSTETITSGKIEKLLSQYEDHCKGVQFSETHNEAYEPVYYFLASKGKRIRPMLLMLSCDLFGGAVEKALHPAFGIELFHNFTLIHDDIMDQADIRRGRPTVHKKYTEGTAILAGDFLMILSYRYLAKVEPTILGSVLQEFNHTATQIIEGQVMDAAFETAIEVSEENYLKMIAYKTSVLLATSLKIGAMIGGASQEDQELIYQFGTNLGLAFQIKDDWLDAYGDASIGKKIGGDIIRNKKTYLFIKAWNRADQDQRVKLQHLLNTDNEDLKITETIHIYNELNIGNEVEKQMDSFYQKAIDSLSLIDIEESRKIDLYDFANKIYHREY